MTTADRRMEERRLARKYRIRAKRAKSDNMRERLTICAEYHEAMVEDLGELIELRAKAVNG